MKKNVFLAAALIALMAAATYAQTESDFQVTTVSNAIRITGYTGSATAVVIPARINNLPVTSIGDEAFFQNKRITSVTIPNSVTNIRRFSFAGCDSLTSVTIQGTITAANFNSIEPFDGDLRDKYLAAGGGTGTYTRSGTTWTKQGTVAPTVQYTSENKFTVTRAGNAATITGITNFSGTDFNHVNIPPTIQNTPVTAIGDRAFLNQGIQRVTIPASVTSIGVQSFASNTSLTSVTFEGRIPESGVNSFAFSGIGDLRAKYLAGGPGTYTRPSGGQTWTKQ